MTSTSPAPSIPATIPDATEQAKLAVQAALAAGQMLVQVEMAIPELQHQPIAEQFLDIFESQQFKVFFPDAGAAALARRDWGNPDFVIRGLGELIEPIDADDDLYLLVNPSSIEVKEVESLCNQVTDQPVVLLNPNLEDIATIGIGYAGRQLRERFISKIQTCYYLRPIDGAAVYRCYPGPWQLWRETSPEEYEWVSDLPNRPSSEDIDRILYGDGSANNQPEEGVAGKAKSTGRKRGLFAELQQFIRALTQ
ncbi:MAG: DUF1995 family protein [Phormidesmis sp.]